MSNAVIIVAGGSGNRFGGPVPKQFALLKGIPLLMQTMAVFHQFAPDIEMVVVLSADMTGYWQDLIKKYAFHIEHTVAEGGSERYESVKGGLMKVQSSGVIAIHDAVRPLVSHGTLTRCFTTAVEKGNAVPAVRLVDSLRRIDADTSFPVTRDHFRLIQTPQCFMKEDLTAAYKQNFHLSFTDDASVMEKAGHSIHLVDGNRENIKITDVTDLRIAEALFESPL